MRTNSEPNPRRTRKGVGLLLLIGALALALFARQWVLDRAVSTSLHQLRSLSESLPEDFEETPLENAQGEAIFPLWPFEPGASLERQSAEEEPPQPSTPEATESPLRRRVPRRVSSQTKAEVRRTLLPIEERPTPQNTTATAERVLSWATAQLVPHGIFRMATDKQPAGIELYGVGALGVGLLDGDRLTHVDGAPVHSRAEVIRAVLAARADGALAMTAGLMRLTSSGPVNFRLVIEQPYLNQEVDTP